MVELEELLGTYHVFTKRTRVEARTYTLKITQSTNDRFEISMELAISGNFGSLGEEWNGTGYLKENTLIFECHERIDWRYTFLDDERQDYVEKKKDTFTAEIINEGTNIILKLSKQVDTILLCKAHEKINAMTYWITREIIAHYELDVQAEIVKPQFWMISNLILKDYNDFEYEENDTIKVVVEYDLDLVKEEKRVIEGKEFVREHHKDKVFLNVKNGYRILKYEYDI